MTQANRILEVLRQARLSGGGSSNGQYSLREMMLSQYHARIWDLERGGIRIEHSTGKDQYGLLSYRLAEGQKRIERGIVGMGPGRPPKVIKTPVW